jgi:predicted transport protein
LDQKIKSEIQEFLSINEQISEFKEEIVRLRKQIPSINVIENKSDIIIKDYIIDDTEDRFLKSVPKEINELYYTLKNQILAIDEQIKVIPRGLFIGFDSQRNFVGIWPQQRKLKIWLNLDKGQLNDPNMIARDVSNKGHWGNGDYEINFSHGDELPYLMTLIKQSYEKNS